MLPWQTVYCRALDVVCYVLCYVCLLIDVGFCCKPGLSAEQVSASASDVMSMYVVVNRIAKVNGWSEAGTCSRMMLLCLATLHEDIRISYYLLGVANSRRTYWSRQSMDYAL